MLNGFAYFIIKNAFFVTIFCNFVYLTYHNQTLYALGNTVIQKLSKLCENG